MGYTREGEALNGEDVPMKVHNKEIKALYRDNKQDFDAKSMEVNTPGEAPLYE